MLPLARSWGASSRAPGRSAGSVGACDGVVAAAEVEQRLAVLAVTELADPAEHDVVVTRLVHRMHRAVDEPDHALEERGAGRRRTPGDAVVLVVALGRHRLRDL